MASTRRRPPMGRRFMTWLLASPFAGLADGSVMLITVRGWRTGAAYTLPVQYAQEGDEIWIVPGHPERKTWWRNLSMPAPVDLRLRGRDIEGTARAYSGRSAPAIVHEGLGAYARRFPRFGRRLGILDRQGSLDGRRLREVAKGTVMVRVEAPGRMAGRGEGLGAPEIGRSPGVIATIR
jgi:deazaflavin-dependent oxidoreductase (nitroreductase family)